MTDGFIKQRAIPSIPLVRTESKCVNVRHFIRLFLISGTFIEQLWEKQLWGAVTFIHESHAFVASDYARVEQPRTGNVHMVAGQQEAPPYILCPQFGAAIEFLGMKPG